MKKSTQGFSLPLVLSIIVVVGVLGIVGWRFYGTSQQNSATQTTNSEATDQTPSQQTPPIDLNEGYVVIKEWGVRFKPVEGLEGVSYAMTSSQNSLSITAKPLSDLEPRCSVNDPDNMPIGLMTRSTDPGEADGGVFVKIEEYSFQYRIGGATCSEDTANIPLESSITKKIIESIRSLEKVPVE